MFKYSIGNSKLGKNCMVVSRQVGPTCLIAGDNPCPYFGDGCYAEKTENRFPDARKVGIGNRDIEEVQVRSMLVEAHRKDNSVRWFERGDAGWNNKPDKKFLSNVRRAYESLPVEQRPDSWLYTHFNKTPEVVEYLQDFVACYASVHNEEDIYAAKDNGFRMFAFCDDEGKYAPKKNARRPYDPAACPKMVEIAGEQFVVCPEIRLGRDRVTCTGTKDTPACNLCPLANKRIATGGKTNPLFPFHA